MEINPKTIQSVYFGKKFGVGYRIFALIVEHSWTSKNYIRIRFTSNYAVPIGVHLYILTKYLGDSYESKRTSVKLRFLKEIFL